MADSINATPESLAEQVKNAHDNQSPLQIMGSGSKSFYGRNINAIPLSVAAYSGVINYEPSELVITARAGTPLREIENLLDEQGQMLGFEPPSFTDTATLGGTIACGISGPRRPYAGAARDFVLGVTIINGKGEILKFGGQVIKNVAGYDVSRLMTGAQGSLGVLLDISLKVIPKPAYEETRVLPYSHQQMNTLLSDIGRKPVPVSATLLHNNSLYIRLSGAKAGVQAAASAIGGDTLQNADPFWQQLKEQQQPFFYQQRPLWRVSLPPAAAVIPGDLIEEESFIEWGGAQRWVYSRNDNKLQEWAIKNGGHASCFRDAKRDPSLSHSADETVFSSLSPALFALSKRIKDSFDPAHILNPNRLYTGL
jgi:glycolate oxidase FAD binding subunit